MSEILTTALRYRPLASENREQLITQFEQALRGRVHEAYFFGSFAKNKAGRDSDIDLILVVNTNESYFERFKEFNDLYKIYPALDLLIYTPQEWARKKKEMKTPGFHWVPKGNWKSVAENLLKIV